MIISASRRTDIPALYVTWLQRRLEAGWCAVPNPFNARQVSRVSLRPEDVDAVVFWTRHARPILPLLPGLDAQGYRYYFQYTITGYGRPAEARTPPLDVALKAFSDLARRLPPGAVVWRYDPILVGAAFPHESHVRRFRRIATALEGHARRVVLSVVDPYQRTARRVGEVLRWGEDVADEPMAWPGIDDLLANLACIARDAGMQPEACAESRDLTGLGIVPTKCIDDGLLRDLFGDAWSSRKDPGQREACRCIPSRDIGMADSCTFGCTYCYATQADEVARKHHAEHDPSSPSLRGWFEPTAKEDPQARLPFA